MSVWDTIIEAARNNETVEITYMKKNGEIVTHEVEPYSVRGDLFYGLRTDVDEIRAFLIDNIIDATKTGNHFEPRWPVEL